MGSSHSSDRKNEHTDELSPEALSQTSVDDKAWLDVTEENLFNESFTNEKYYLLHSRRGEESEGRSAAIVQRERAKRQEELELLKKGKEAVAVGILDWQDPVQQHLDAISQLVNELQHSSVKKTTYYDSILEKRISILKRIHLALSRERAREKLLVSSPEYGSKTKSPPVPTVIRMAIRLFITMLKEQKDKQITSSTLATLNAMLRELPLLCFQGEPQDCLDSFHNWLSAVVTDVSDTSIKNESMESLLMLDLHTGSLSALLSVVKVLLDNTGLYSDKEDTTNEQFSSLRMVPFLRKLADWQVDLPLSPLSKERFSGSWMIMWNEVLGNSSAAFMFAPTSIATMASSGSFIFLHDACGLVKIGTGFAYESQDLSTTQGKIYARNSDWKLEEKGWLGVVQGKLYYRSPSIDGATFVVFDVQTLKEIGTIFQDGSGTIATADNSDHSFGPESNSDPKTQGTERSPMTSDGRYLYIIGQYKSQKYGSINYRVDIYDPCNMMNHVRRVKLRYSESRKSMSTASVLNPKVLEKGSFYTNGHYLMIVIPPPLATDYNYDHRTYLCRSFSLRDGTLIGNFSLENHPIGSASCYDAVNNFIWNYNSTGAEISRYTNEGLAPKHKFPSTSQAIFSSTISLPESEDHPMEAVEVVISLLEILGRLSVDSMPSSSEYKLGTSKSQQLNRLKEPFCVEVNPETFSFLVFILDKCKEKALNSQKNPVHHIQCFEIVLYCLRIIKVNLFRLSSSHLKSAKACLEKSGAVLKQLRDILLQLIYSWNERALELLQTEACQVFTVGIDLFYKDSLEQAHLVLNLLNAEDKENAPGRKLLLNSLLELYATRVNSSYLVLPASKDQKFEPIFIPIISHLLQEAQNLSTQFPALDTSSNAAYITSPPVHLLMSLQKDLLLRAAQITNENDDVIKALVQYANLIISNCTKMFGESFSKESPAFEKLLQEIRFSIYGGLLPTLTNSLFLFQTHIWLAKMLLPSLIEFIQVLDKVNKRLPPLPASKLYFIQKRAEFIEGPSRISETPHPPIAMHSRQIIHIPEAVFLSLVFDERSGTSGSEDFLQLFQDPECTQPIGERYYGDSARWPKNRVLIPGDTVVFNFHAENSENCWGYRCVVIGHMPDSDHESIPWTVHLQKTLCCLGGQFAGLLVTGSEINVEEVMYGTLLKSPALISGIEEKLVPDLLENFGVLPKIGWEDIGKSPSDFLQSDEGKDDVETMNFCWDLFHRKSETDGAVLMDWVDESLNRRAEEESLSFKRAKSAFVAVILKHTELVKEAIELTIPSKSDVPKRNSNSNRRVRALDLVPSAQFIQLWDITKKLKPAIIQRYQEQQQSRSFLVEESASKRRSTNLDSFPGQAKSIAAQREESLKKIADVMIEKAEFLMHCLNVKGDAEEITTSILNFMTSPLKLDEIKKLVMIRRARAFSRIIGFQAFQVLLKNLQYPSMKHEVICFLAPALRSSGMSKHPWPHHYLDHLEGSGLVLARAVTSAFTSLMVDVAAILKDDTADASLQLLALDSWLLDFRPSDHKFLHSVDIFQNIHILSYKDFSPIVLSLRDMELIKFEQQLRPKLKSFAKSLFRLLGSIIMGVDKPHADSPRKDKVPDALQESFFILMASELESTPIMQAHETGMDSGKMETAKNLDTNKRRVIDIDWFETMIFLYTLSASSVAKSSLSQSRFLRIFLSLLQTGNERLQLLLLRLFRRILPHQNPGDLVVQKGKDIATFLFEIIGSIHCLSPEIEKLSNTYPIVQSLAIGMISRNISRFSFDKSKSALLHPFFPLHLQDPSAQLPIGWEKKTGKSPITYQDKNRTAEFPGTTNKEDDPLIIRADSAISDSLRLFYYEIKIENFEGEGRIGMGLVSYDQRLKGMPGITKSSYGYHSDGNKYNPKVLQNTQTYAPTYGKSDIIGCGWNLKEGIVFFTKNGKFLGIAFKNVFGRYFPSVAIKGGAKASISCNFGHSPFAFDVNELLEGTEDKEDHKIMTGHIALAFASETVILLRYLSRFPNWKNYILDFVNNSLNRIPALIRDLLASQPSVGTTLPSSIDYSTITHVIASLAVMGGLPEGLRMGGTVEVEFQETFMEKQQGVIVEYAPRGAHAVVVLTSVNEIQKIPAIYDVSCLKPIPEIPFESNLFPFSATLLSNISLFLQPFTALEQKDKLALTTFNYLRALAMKTLQCSFHNPSCINYFLEREMVPILVESALEPADEHPKVFRTEKRALMLQEQLFDMSAGTIRKDSNTQKKKGRESLVFKRGSKLIDYSSNYLHQDKTTNDNNEESKQENEEPDDLNDEGVEGVRVKWEEVKIGMYLIVAKRESSEKNFSDWVSAMDKTIGMIGLVKALDWSTKQVHLNFFEGDTACSYSYWFSYRVLATVEKVKKDPFQQLTEAPRDNLLYLANTTYRSLGILYARMAVVSLFGSISTGSLSLEMVGGPQSLVNLLKLTVIDGIASPLAQDRFLRTDIKKQYLSKLTHLLKQDTVRSILPSKSKEEKGKKPNDPQKSGVLYKKGKLFKGWKSKWFVLQGNTLSYFKAPSTPTPSGTIDLKETSVENLSIAKNSEFCFKLVSSRRTFYLKANSQKEYEEWLVLIESVKDVPVPINPRASAYMFVDGTLCQILTRVIVRHLTETIEQELPVRVEESPHPYSPNTKFKKLISIESAEKILVVFDPDSDIYKFDSLRFFKDVSLKNGVASFSGRGPAMYPATVVDSDRFWISFTSENSPARWGYKMYITALSSRLSDEAVLRKPNFDFVMCLIDWMLSMIPLWVKDFFSAEVYNALVAHLAYVGSSKDLNKRIKVINALTRLLRHYREFPKDKQPDISKLRFLKQEMFELLEKEKRIGETSHSYYLQRLTELVINAEIVEDWQRKQGIFVDIGGKEEIGSRDSIELPISPGVKRALPIPIKSIPSIPPEKRASKDKTVIKSPSIGKDDKSFLMRKSIERTVSKESMPKIGSPSTSSSFISNSNSSFKDEMRGEDKGRDKLKEDKKGDVKKDKKPQGPRNSFDYWTWFKNAVTATKVMNKLVRGENFPRKFTRLSCREALKQVISEESPHPYPPGVRVTSTVHIPGAQTLVVNFDPRTRTEKHIDYLMFSLVSAGGDDLGLFSGEFSKETIVVHGDQFIWSFMSDSAVQGHWGFRFTVTPVFPDEKYHELEVKSEHEFQQNLSYADQWNLTKDHELVTFINSYCEKYHTTAHDFSLNKVNPAELNAYPSLGDLSKQSLEYRVNLLKYFNTMVLSLLPMIDLKNSNEEWSLAWLTCTLRGLIFFDIKIGLLNDILARTNSNLRRPVVNLNRQQEKLKEEPLLVQGCKELLQIDPAKLRQGDRAFEVKLENEGAEDAGGPYRECLTQFCQDISSKEIGLFIPCVNAKEEVWFNQDKLVPDPTLNSPEKLSQFEFVGKLIGISIRTKNTLDLTFPSVVWKPLTGQRIERSDLEAIDKRTYQFIDSIRNIEKEGVTKQTFNDTIFETFTTQSLTGNVVELKPGGSKISVTWNNKDEFVHLIELFKLNEFHLQTEAIARGVSQIVPIQLLSLLTWQELELRVCGRPGIDLDYLMRHTEYNGISPEEKIVSDFWQVLKSLTPADQGLFLRFVSGRSRLPPETEFNTRFRIQAFTKADEGKHDDFLPEAQTCFFSLSLPNYSSPEILREKLLYAINTCKEIDTDFEVRDRFTQDEEEVTQGPQENSSRNECATQ